MAIGTRWPKTIDMFHVLIFQVILSQQHLHGKSFNQGECYNDYS